MGWDWYESHAAAVVPHYEAADPAVLHAWLADLLPTQPAAILDIGAGRGRDAAWLAAQGHDVAAAEACSRHAGRGPAAPS